MSENKPLVKEEIINEDENLQIEPEIKSDDEKDSEDSEQAADVVAPAGDDGGGSAPSPGKERG